MGGFEAERPESMPQCRFFLPVCSIFRIFSDVNEHIKLYESVSAKVFAINPDILYLIVPSGQSFTTAESHTISNLAFTHFNGKYKVLTVPEEHATIESDVRNYLVTPERKERVIADAIVITNLPHRLLADFYLKVQRPDIPTQFFKTYDEALAWLRSVE